MLSCKGQGVLSLAQSVVAPVTKVGFRNQSSFQRASPGSASASSCRQARLGSLLVTTALHLGARRRGTGRGKDMGAASLGPWVDKSGWWPEVG